MKITPSEYLKKVEDKKRKDFVFSKKSKEPVYILLSTINTMKEYYNGLIQYHLTLRTAAEKQTINAEIAKVRTWLDAQNKRLEKEKSPPGRQALILGLNSNK